MTDEWLDQDAIGSYHEAIRAIGERVKNGEPIPDLFTSDIGRTDE